MKENASLGDYLFEFRRGVAPGSLMLATGAGVLLAAGGLVLGPRFAALTGAGVAVSGICAWARLNQAADAMLDGSFGARQPERARRFRAAGVACLTVGGVGTLLFLYSFLARFVLVSTGM